MDETREELAADVQHFRVCWELWPLKYPNEAGDVVQVGYELDLCGTPPGDRGSLLPGEDRGFDLFQTLGRIARYAIGEVPPSVSYEIEVFDGAVHYAKRRNDRPDVTLKLEITHRDRYTAPLDRAESEFVKSITLALESLGVQQNSWHPPKS